MYQHLLVRAAIVAGIAAALSSPAAAGAAQPGALPVVEHTNPEANPGACYLEPGDLPGLDIFVEATCTFVHVPTDELQITARAQLPEQYVPSSTFTGELTSCFGGTGRIVATKSGFVQATCRLAPDPFR